MKPKRTLRETLAENKSAMDYYARMAGKEPVQMPEMMKTKRASPKPSELPRESQEQRAFVKWFRLQYPKVRIIAIPNGSMRDPITGAILRGEGVSPGVPDLFVPEWLLWIEMKRQARFAISDEQRDWEHYLLGIGHHHFYAYGCEDAMQKVKQFVDDMDMCRVRI